MTTSTWTPRAQAADLGEDTVHLWRVSLDVKERTLERCRAVLDDDEHHRADRFRASRQTQRFAVARGTLRHLLSDYLHMEADQLRFAYGEHGKPRLEQSATPVSGAPLSTDLHFNVSHSGGVALMAFAQRRDLGVDVERTEREVGWERVARRFFSRPELDELMALPPAQRRSGFFRCWTCKEAYMKATGRGITLGLGNFGVRVDPRRPAQLLWAAERRVEDWSLLAVDPGPNTAGALCVAGDGGLQIECFAPTE